MVAVGLAVDADAVVDSVVEAGERSRKMQGYLLQHPQNSIPRTMMKLRMRMLPTGTQGLQQHLVKTMVRTTVGKLDQRLDPEMSNTLRMRRPR
jgi:hypothetical protein